MIIRIIITLLLTHFIVQAQCNKDPKVLEIQEKINNNPNFDSSLESDYLCKAYYELACKARYNSFELKDKVYPRTKHHAHNIEGQALDVIDRYNKLGLKSCGELTPLVAVYKDSVGVRNENIVGFWISKEVIYNKTHYPELYFDNDGHLNNSFVESVEEKSTWRKISENHYELTQSWYDDYLKDFTEPKKSKFLINPKTNTAIHKFTNHLGEEIQATFYFKGNFYHNYGKTEEEILTPISTSLHLLRW